MKISQISITGYKTLVDFKLGDLQRDLNIFIGENNVGKSNILKALNAFFNKQKYDENDLPVSLYSILETKDSPYIIELNFTDIPPNTRNNDWLHNNQISIRALFKGANKSWHIKNKSGTYINLKEPEVILPHFVYLGDLLEKDFDITSLFKAFPEVDRLDQKVKFETYSNQFLKQLWSSGVSLSVTTSEESVKDIIVVDEYGNSNSFKHKSSGVQQMVYLSMFYALNLLSGKSNVILGIEEPESNLHTTLQKKVFSHIRNHSAGVQTFITTHSPIFVDRIEKSRVFHVKRNSNFHTVVKSKGFKNNWLELRQDLGLEIGDSLLLGKLNLVVEGPTEKILFPKIINLLYEEDKIKYKPEDINILSAQGAQNTFFFSKLVAQTGAKTIVLLDDDKEGRNAKRKIENDETLKHTVITELMKKVGFEETEVEDLIDDNLLIRCINTLSESELTVEEFNVERLNTNSSEQKLKKFSKTFSKWEDDASFSKVSKLSLANEIKNNLKLDDVELIIPIFLKLNNILKEI